jgi:hypothetical protein
MTGRRRSEWDQLTPLLRALLVSIWLIGFIAIGLLATGHRFLGAIFFVVGALLAFVMSAAPRGVKK